MKMHARINTVGVKKTLHCNVEMIYMPDTNIYIVQSSKSHKHYTEARHVVPAVSTEI